MKTHCLRGHELTSANVRVEGARRRCRACQKLREELYKQRHPERPRQAAKRYADAHRDEINRKARDASKPDTERRKASLYVTARQKRIRVEIIAMLGGCCTRCGFSDSRALQIDHVHGGGQKEMRSGTGRYYRSIRDRVIAKTGEFQVLCANCNAIKRIEEHECATGRWTHKKAA